MTGDDVDFGAPPRGVRGMAIARWILIAVMAVIAALSVAYSFGLLSGGSASAASVQYHCPMHPQVVQDHPGECPICSMTLVKRASSEEEKHDTTGQEQSETSGGAHHGHRHEPSDPYFCPMHPEETGLDAKARCPVCGMKLEKRPEAASAPAGVVGLVPLSLSADRVQTIGVRTARARAEELVTELSTVGYVSADEARLARVHTRFAGWIEQLKVPVTGQKVSRGQVLAGLYNLELLPAQQEFLAARRWSTRNGAAPAQGATPTATLSLERDARARLELFGLSRSEIDQVAQTGKPMRTVAVTAPISGYVTRNNAVLGGYAQPDTELFAIADLSRVWVLAEVYEHEIARVRLGQAAEVLVSSYPGQRFSGKIGFISPTLDPTTRTLRVRVELDNEGLTLRPGMYADVRIRLEAASGVVVPVEALIDTGRHQYVFIAKDAGRFEPRRVQAGPRSGDGVQILTGLSAGERVVTTANFLIDSESRLQAAIEGTASPESAE